MPATYHYTVYGLHLTTDRPLSEALPAPPPEPGQIPVSIHLVEHIPALPMQPNPSQSSYYTHPYRDANLLVLMRHRAVLLGIVGGLLVVSAFHAPLRPVGIAVGLTSMLSFVLIAWLVGGYNPELRRVVVVDLVASAALLGAALLDRSAATGGLAA